MVTKTSTNDAVPSLDDLIRKWKKDIKKADVLMECRKREAFLNKRQLKKFKRDLKRK